MIDCHAHVMLEASLGAAGDLGPWIEETPDGRPRFRIGDWVLDGVEYRTSAFMDVDVRLARMAEVGITHQVLSPNPLLWFHHIPAADAVAFSRTHNEALAALVSAHADRLSGLAHLPVQDPTGAADELRHGVGLGLRGGAIGTSFPTTIDDPALDPIWAAATDLGVPIFIHPGPSGIDGPADARLNRLSFDLHGGFAAEETLTVWHLIAGGVLDRHPELDLVLSHGGGATAVLLGRWRHAMATRPGLSGDADGVDRAVRRLWFDTHMGSATAVAALAAQVGTDRLLFGTNFAGWDEADPASITTEVGLDQVTLTANARRLFEDSTAPGRLPVMN